MNNWSVTNLWNASLDQIEPRQSEERDHLWATDFGSSQIDTYLKLKGEAFTNPPNPRSIRKFEAGHFWEAIIKHVLLRAGILRAYQEHLKHRYEGLLEVTGRLDFIAGGKLDYEQATNYIENDTLWLPEGFRRGIKGIVEGLHNQFGETELKLLIIDVKSTSSFMMNAFEILQTGHLHHKLQIYHYLKCKGMDEGRLVYICRDDCRMLEIPVYLNDERLEKAYREYIEKATWAYRTNTLPEKEKLIVYSADTGKVSKNYKIEYSNYLSKLYGFAEPINYRDVVDSMVNKFSRVVGRYANGDKITENNLQVMEEMKKYLTQNEINEAIEMKKKMIALKLSEVENAE